MKRLLTIIAYLISIQLFVSVSYAAPENLGTAKKAVIDYHDSGEYDKDFQKIASDALQYLKAHDKTPKNPNQKLAIVLDIDETSLSNYEDMLGLSFGGTIDQVRTNEMKAHDKPFVPTLELYNYALQNHIAIIFITGRPIEERHATIKNLKKTGFKNWDKIIFREGKTKGIPASEYKSATRKEMTDKGYQIIMNMGDQLSDLDGGYSEKDYKLPNPFYTIL